MTLVRNHARGILACDFFVTVTASFRVLYGLVIMEVETRRIAHFNVTPHRTADWAFQQFRGILTGQEPYRFLIHDRDSIYSSELDSALKSTGLRISKTPFRAFPTRLLFLFTPNLQGNTFSIFNHVRLERKKVFLLFVVLREILDVI